MKAIKFEKNRKEKLQIQNKINIEYNEHASNSIDNTIEDIRRNTNFTKILSNSENDQVRKSSKQEERNHTPREINLEMIVVVVDIYGF